MTWDSLLALAVADELERALGGARARSVSLGRAAMVATVRFRGATLLADLAPGRGTITLQFESGAPDLPGKEEDSDANPLPAILTAVDAVPDERTLIFRFRRVRGRRENPALILEFQTNRENAILALGPSLRVIKRLRQRRGRREPVGQPWAPESPGGSDGPRKVVTLAEWEALVGGEDPRRALLSAVAHVSGINVASLLGAPTPAQGFQRWKTITELGGAQPQLLNLSSGPQPYPCPLAGVQSKPCASVLSAMETVRESSAGAPAPTETLRRISARRRRQERKVLQLKRQLQKTLQADALRERGTLILSRLHAIEPGSDSVTLTGFDGAPVTIALDPKRSAQDAANRLFHQARRLERGARRVTEKIKEARDRIAHLADLETRIGQGEDPRIAGALYARAEPDAKGTRHSKRAEPSLPYTSYLSSGGIEIRVGRGAAHNDELTFHYARPNDVWLHARHASGAHVVLRWPRPERPPRSDLEEAATLAAIHSKGRDSGVVPVDWTRRKWVRKPRGAPRGAVSLERVETVFVQPDPSLRERLVRPG